MEPARLSRQPLFGGKPELKMDLLNRGRRSKPVCGQKATSLSTSTLRVTPIGDDALTRPSEPKKCQATRIPSSGPPQPTLHPQVA